MATKSYQPTEFALQALKSDEFITVSNESYISFMPNTKMDTGIIFYPGAKVEPEAYAPLMRQLAEAGYLSFIAKMPLNFAVLSPDEADHIIEDYPDIKNWYIIGHSLGGVVASQYVYENENIVGLILLASYPQEKHDLSERPISALTISGSKDGLISLEKINSKKKFLPKDTTHIVIDGGNHAQMGSYGIQSKDLEATITPEEQQSIIYNAILKLLKTPTEM